MALNNERGNSCSKKGLWHTLCHKENKTIENKNPVKIDITGLN